MSAQGYTNRIRVLVEASLTKTQYPANMISDNKLSASINCGPNFATVIYPYICPCTPNIRGNR